MTDALMPPYSLKGVDKFRDGALATQSTLFISAGVTATWVPSMSSDCSRLFAAILTRAAMVEPGIHGARREPLLPIMAGYREQRSLLLPEPLFQVFPMNDS